MSRRIAVLAALVLLGATLSGCLGFGARSGDDDDEDDAAIRALVGDRTRDLVAERLQAVPTNYTFDGQQELEWFTHYFNGTVDQSANTAYRDRNDRGANKYGVVRFVEDVAKFIPAGQPTEMHITLSHMNQPGNSVKCSLYVDVPGTKLDYYGGNNDEFNWKFSVQRTVVNTVGAPGRPHDVGVECSNGRLTGTMPFSVRIDFSYERDVFTPYHPYAFTVPSNASGIILESAKAGGPEHVKASFVVIDPDDRLVQYVLFDDINIPTESVFIPTTQPGEYVFYAHYMQGGFLGMRADAPVEDRAVRILPLREESIVHAGGPAPGLAERDWGHGSDVAGLLANPGAGGEEVSFNVDGAFPLRITPFIGEPASSRTLMTDVKISSGSGLVARMQRVLHYVDDRGSLGYTQDHWNSAFHPENLVAGAYTVQIVNNSPDAAVGHVMTTYVR